MKRSLLLISIFCFAGMVAFGQKVVQSGARTHASDSPKAGHSAQAKSSGSKGKKHSTKKKKETVIVHTAPDQQRIDSIKKEKMKHKQ